MENKNLIIAIVLSTSILLGWSLFFENPEKINEQNQKQTEKKLSKSETPSIEKESTVKIVSRNEAIKEGGRVEVENNSLVGNMYVYKKYFLLQRVEMCG